ncbi:hypothetical protein HYV80_05985 [Candidatus Woesearchaeota archaeon]|nr:hypothetical protein [Candidatus Woesearchaeota archaeon]
MKKYFYIKVNLEEWERENKKYCDWDFLDDEEIEDFFTYHKNTNCWLEADVGDILICHSSYMNMGSSKDPKFVPRPRITAISVIAQRKHVSKNSGEEVVTIRKKISLPRPILKREIEDNPIIKNSKPHKPGTSRCTINEIKDVEYKEFIKEILKKNPNLKHKVEELEKE